MSTVVNPNALSNAEYAAYAARMQPDSPEEVLLKQVGTPVIPQNMAALANSTPSWGAAPSGWMAQMASDIANRGGMAVQQNGYDSTAAVPVAAGPAWAGPSPMPAYERSGVNVSIPGSEEAWQNWGVPPVIMQSDPYATAAYRTYTNPYGQIGVQPLIGFPSRYPHVLSGVPNSPFRVQGFINSLLPQAGFMPFMGMPFMGGMGMGTGMARGGATNTGRGNNSNKGKPPDNTNNTSPALQPETIPPFIGWQGEGQNTPTMHRGDYIGQLSPEGQAWLNSLNLQTPAPSTRRPVTPLPDTYADGPWVGGYNPYAPAQDTSSTAAPMMQTPLPDTYADGPWVGGYNPYAPTQAPSVTPAPQIQSPIHSPAETFITPQVPVAPFAPPAQTIPQIPAPVNDSLAMLPSALWGYYG